MMSKSTKQAILRWSFLLLGLLAPLMLVVPVAAQPPISSYWQHTASAQINLLISDDITADGVADILLATVGDRLELLDAAGKLIWQHQVNDPIYAIQAINIDETPEKEVVLATANELIVLSATGTRRWQRQIAANPSLDILPFSAGANEGKLGLLNAPAQPKALLPFDSNRDGRFEIALLFASSQLVLVDANGDLLWRNVQNVTLDRVFASLVTATDINDDGQQELVRSFYDGRLSYFQLINHDGNNIWQAPVLASGKITGLAAVNFQDGSGDHIAIATDRGELKLYKDNDERIWLRTLNRPITALKFVPTALPPLLIVGTDTGSVVAYTGREGRRLWNQSLDPTGSRAIMQLSATDSALLSQSDPQLAAVLVSMDSDSDEPADVVLLAPDGRRLESFSGVDTNALTQLVDINGDRKSELLTGRFSRIELVGLGVGFDETATEWEYQFNAAPTAMLALDIDQNGTDELLLGTENGRLIWLDQTGEAQLVHAPGGEISHLRPFRTGNAAGFIVVRQYPAVDNNTPGISWVEFREANGERIWQTELPAQISSLLVLEGRADARLPAVIVGTTEGSLYAYNSLGLPFWTEAQEMAVAPISQLVFQPATTLYDSALIATADNRLFKVDLTNHTSQEIATFNDTILKLARLPAIPDNQELNVGLLAFVADGTIHGLNWRGIEMAHLNWPLDLQEGITNTWLTTGTAVDTAATFVVATENNNLLHLTVQDGQPALKWWLSDIGDLSQLYWNDLNGDERAEMVVSSKRGRLTLYAQVDSAQPRATGNELLLTSNIFDITRLNALNEPNLNLVVITENGQVQLLQAKENRPPLLTSPNVSITEDEYIISVALQDIDRDTVQVSLELFQSNSWTTYGTPQTLTSRVGNFSWVIENPNLDGVTYRFHYTDGFHEGYFTPAAGPPPLTAPEPLVSPEIILTLSIISIFAFILLVRQWQLPESRAARFYRQIEQNPTMTLPVFERRYTLMEGAPDFLLSLANRARQKENSIIANMADGFYLLADRPNAGLPIIVNALNEAAARANPWQDLERWREVYTLGQALFEAPSLTELTLLRPQLNDLLIKLEERELWIPILNALQPILKNIRDSERVEAIDDHLVYLNSAAVLLNNLLNRISDYSVTPDRQLVENIAKRWLGLVSAEIESLRGRAELAISLKTKRFISAAQMDVTFLIENKGRAAAENLLVAVDENPAYTVHSHPETISILPPGRVQEVSFLIDPKVDDRFRILVQVTFDDRNRQDKEVAFGDMILLIQPAAVFKVINNPYLPGTPLRRDSPIFFGRRELFSFIADNIGVGAQQKVLMLIGQRRTGKTSALLRLDHYLPDYLLPVYIDCQSLGITPGMGALLHDLAWYIADALATRQIELEVPSIELWQSDPIGRFQRQFLPAVRLLLPADTVLLLVFDEFETLEFLVNDGMLPNSVFNYLRHLMQHNERLSFAFVGTHRLEEMSADYWSVLFNIALYQKIGYLRRQTAVRLITEPVAPNLVYDDLALDKILRVTAGHPYFVQLVCYTLVKQANSRRSTYVTISDVNTALDEMLSLGEVHFAYLWQRSGYTEKMILTAVAHLLDWESPFHPEEVVQQLAPYGIEFSPAEITAALHRLVERDIMQEVSEGTVAQYELKIGLVALWVSKQKSLSRLYTLSLEAKVTSALAGSTN